MKHIAIALTFALSFGAALGATVWLRRQTSPAPDRWPRISAYDLEVDLTRPGAFAGTYRVAFEDVPEGEVCFLLNRSLRVVAARADDETVDVEHGRRLDARYHSEGRLVRATVDPPPGDGRVVLVLEVEGEAARGTAGSDWRGILFVDAVEARMSEQTVFYPQVPLALDGTAIVEAPFDLRVHAPATWEVYAPLPPTGRAADGERATWTFAGERPQVLSILGGERARHEARRGDMAVVVLLRAEHADLAAPFVDEASAVLAACERRFGAIEAGHLGVFEMTCRDGSSYNWTSEGAIAFDRHALGREVPVATLAHEVAHLWWGQAVEATGPAERFLTEGLAEHTAWSVLEAADRADLVRPRADGARREVAELVEAGESDALREVAFGHPRYTELAYGKSAVVLRALDGQLPPGALDAALARLVRLGAERPVTVEDLLEGLRAAIDPRLRVPWLDGGGDLDLELAALEAHGPDRARLSVRARPATARCTLDPAGTPVAVLVGGDGWSARHTILLTGAETAAAVDVGAKAVTWARIDPDGAWTRPLRVGQIVLDGARLVESEPPRGPGARFGGGRIALTFDRPVVVPELEAVRARQAAAADVSTHGLALRGLRTSEDGRTVELETEPWRPDRAYRVVLAGWTDRGGTPVTVETFEFATAPSDDRTAPRIVATVPANGATVPAGPLTVSVTFDETMHAGQGFRGTAVRANRRRGLEFPDFDDFGTWDPGQRTITWTIAAPVPGTTYVLPFTDSPFRDLSGNGVAEFELAFTVAE